jgi:hypothetical protein
MGEPGGMRSTVDPIHFASSICPTGLIVEEKGKLGNP